MNVVFLSPHFPPHYFRFCLNLKAAGANVLGVGDKPYDNLSQDVRAALTEYYQIDDMHNYDALVRACGYFTSNFSRRRLTNMCPWKSICGRRAAISPICLTTPVISTSTGSGPICWSTVGRILIMREIITAAMPAASTTYAMSTAMRISCHAMAHLWSRSKAFPEYSAAPWAISAIFSDLKVWMKY